MSAGLSLARTDSQDDCSISRSRGSRMPTASCLVALRRRRTPVVPSQVVAAQEAIAGGAYPALAAEPGTVMAFGALRQELVGKSAAGNPCTSAVWSPTTTARL